MPDIAATDFVDQVAPRNPFLTRAIDAALVDQNQSYLDCARLWQGGPGSLGYPLTQASAPDTDPMRFAINLPPYREGVAVGAAITGAGWLRLLGEGESYYSELRVDNEDYGHDWKAAQWVWTQFGIGSKAADGTDWAVALANATPGLWAIRYVDAWLVPDGGKTIWCHIGPVCIPLPRLPHRPLIV